MSPAAACRPPFRPSLRRGGFTVIEAAVAGAIIVLFLTSLFALNSTVMRLLGSAAETANASQHLQQRVEQVRLANWNQITDPSWLQANLLAAKTDAAVNLPGMQESVTITPYLSPSSATPATPPPGYFTVKRDPTGQLTVTPTGYSSAGLMAKQEMVQVDVSVTWPGWTRSRTRILTTLVSRWGISK